MHVSRLQLFQPWNLPAAHRGPHINETESTELEVTDTVASSPSSHNDAILDTRVEVHDLDDVHGSIHSPARCLDNVHEAPTQAAPAVLGCELFPRDDMNDHVHQRDNSSVREAWPSTFASCRPPISDAWPLTFSSCSAPDNPRDLTWLP